MQVDQPQTFHIKSLVRSVQTRVRRYEAPAAIRRVQYVLDTQQRLLPGRSLEVSSADVQRNRVHLKELEVLGICSVYAPDGRKLDLDTFRVADPMAEPAQPNFRLDSVANDRKPGEIFTLQYQSPGVAPAPELVLAAPATVQSTPTVEVGPNLGFLGDPLLANPDFAPSGDPEVSEEDETPAQPSFKKNKRR